MTIMQTIFASSGFSSPTVKTVMETERISAFRPRKIVEKPVTQDIDTLSWGGKNFTRVTTENDRIIPSILSVTNWEKFNTRRILLINRKYDDKLSVSETVELARLQDIASEYVREVAPLPFDALDAFEEELRRRGL